MYNCNVIIICIVFGGIIGATAGASYGRCVCAIVGFILGVIAGIIASLIHLIGVKLKIWGRLRECPKCGSRNTELYPYGEKGMIFSAHKFICQDCGYEEIIS